MVFTTQTFLFAFLPLCLLIYWGAEAAARCKRIGNFIRFIRLSDCVLIVFGLGFYMWACFDDVIRLLVYIGIVYLFALWIHGSKRKKRYIAIFSTQPGSTDIASGAFSLGVLPFCIGTAAVIFCLIYYNYTGILAQIWNWAFRDHVEIKSLVAPLGLSFLTFSAVSYLTDIYRGNATPGSLIDCALYLTFFPKIVSGPIVLWKDFQPQIKERVAFSGITDGLNRIMIGFAKKIILADSFGACIAQIGTSGIDRVTAFGTLILYMLQIYYDFSGYSDIAIGLSRLFGFQIKENFHFPYRATSISEFWRRWHISLGAWFREYVYFPLGGSRAGYSKTLRNLAIVFVLTGIWHGAGWNYIFWGLLNGALVVTERIVRDKSFYKKTPKFIKYCGTMLIVMLFWQLFRFPSISEAANILGIVLGTVQFDRIFYTWQYYFDPQIVIFSLVGLLGATVLGSPKLHRLYQKAISTGAGYLLQEIVLLALFVLSILFMVNSTYRPFIYFQY